MPSWDKLLLACMSIIYFICLADFISRSKEDALSPIEQCGLLEKVEYANRIRRSELAVMLHLKAVGSSNPTKIRFRNDKTPSKTYEMLKRIPASEVCVSTVASPILGFLKYPIQVRSSGGELYFQTNMRSTYLDSKPYIFWFFIIPVSFVLAKLLNDWASRKRENA